MSLPYPVTGIAGEHDVDGQARSTKDCPAPYSGRLSTVATDVGIRAAGIRMYTVVCYLPGSGCELSYSGEGPDVSQYVLVRNVIR